MRPMKDPSTIVLGGRQLALLQLVFALKENAYGGEMYRTLLEREDAIALPQIYRTLDQLENKGLVKHRFVEPVSDRRGGKRKVYEITASGHRVLSSSLQENPQLGKRTGWYLPGVVS